MPDIFTVQKMVDQALMNIEQIDLHLGFIREGFRINMLGKTEDEATAEWKTQLELHRKLDAEMIAAILADDRNHVHVDVRRFPEFTTSK